MTTSHIKCPDCDEGWVRVPDGYGCVDWDHCFECKGYGYIETKQTEKENAECQK